MRLKKEGIEGESENDKERDLEREGESENDKERDLEREGTEEMVQGRDERVRDTPGTGPTNEVKARNETGQGPRTIVGIKGREKDTGIETKGIGQTSTDKAHLLPLVNNKR
eukprot:TRINITY_DN11490_c0_g1_i1.p2 TRINITY_DN11490_c0_g1~~TRINITY_DN11490_c0_g1_i1.p2  ORF type:complete len:111 (-),score=32.92 TRINITY_DN11490_c0_g1_i1:273-605(-)